MAIRRSFSPSLKAKLYHSDGHTLKNCMNYNFHVQQTPPLSLQQYARSIAPIPGADPWFYAYKRKYSIPTYSLKQYKDRKPTPPEPIWYPVSPYRDKRPTSLSPEKRWQQSIHEPIWQPTGPIQHKTIPYFDPPNLRWSLQQLLKSVPNLETKPFSPSKSVLISKEQDF
ncbi:hypothetical protein I4U23_002617 [Adineta vaga]|nr:hypothetical protein I4U23_002617 [Adineta vaga]